MKKRLLVLLVIIAACGAILSNIEVSLALGFNDPGFANTWNRVDKPVQDVPGLGRGYTWGPPIAESQVPATEVYNGLPRKVQYFDKARMEVNNLAANPNDLFYVTTGLLVKELVTGARQDGDNTFTSLPPSTVQIAGDPNDNGANAVAPTYTSFKNVGTFEGTENQKDSAPGSLINSRIDNGGAVSSFSPPEQRFIGGYDSVIRHNMADVFVGYANQTGPIWNGSGFANGPVFFGNSVYVLGRPLAEPLWTRAVVAGVERDVLVQLFERRVLTYTPSNPPAYRVEMGNVGQHYYKWRYGLNGSTPAAATNLPPSSFTPVDFKGNGRVQDGKFYSPILGRYMPYRVYLPSGYDSGDARYPVLYMLHGYSGDYLEWWNIGLIGRASDLAGSGKIKPFLIVLPLGEQAYWVNWANGGPRWSDYVAEDVVGHIDSTYRTQADPAHRAIGGLSMGAHGALQISFNHPGVFGIVGAHSPTMRTKETSPDYFGDAAYYATLDPISLAKTKDLSGYKIWIDIGGDDSLWKPRADELHQVLLSRNFAHTWQIWPGEHTGEYWASHCPDYLQFYSSAFP